MAYEDPNRDILSSLMQQMGGGGLFGMGDAATGGMFTLGGSVLGGLAGLFRGESEGSRKARRVFNLAQNRLGQSILDPDQYMMDYYRAMAPQWNRAGEDIGRRLGMDSGVARGAMIDRIQPSLAQMMFQLKSRNDELMSSRDSQLLQLMGGLTSAIE